MRSDGNECSPPCQRAAPLISVHVGKGRSKFQVEGSVSSIGPGSVAVQIKTGTNSVEGLRGQESVFEIAGSTKITLKGKVMTIDRILVGDRVHIGGTVDSSGAAQRLIALRVIIRPRHSEIDGSLENSSIPPESAETSSSVATAIISWLRSLF